MSTPLRVLMIEDSEDDVVLLMRELKRGDFEVTYEMVCTPQKMIAALENKTWDLILCDCIMPHFSGLEALKILKEKNIDTPVIMISGKVGEETAVSVMQAGARDFVLKGHLFKLVPIIERELKEAQSRRLRVNELKEINNLVVGMERRIMDLEKEVNGLLKELGRENKYR